MKKETKKPVKRSHSRMQTVGLDEITDRYIGKKGTPGRAGFRDELRLDLLRDAIKAARNEI